MLEKVPFLKLLVEEVFSSVIIILKRFTFLREMKSNSQETSETEDEVVKQSMRLNIGRKSEIKEK